MSLKYVILMKKILVYANRRVIHQWDSQYQKGAILNLPLMK